MQTTFSSARIQEAKLHQTIVEIQLEQNQKANSLQVALQTAYDQLQVSINNWKLAYLFTAPTDGILSYNEVWQKNQNITAGGKYFLLWRKIRGLSSARQSCLFPTRAK